MNSTHMSTNAVFLNVRKAYRLLHDYQRMVLDAVNHIGAQLDIPYNGGWSKLAGDTRSGWTKLFQSSWDWLAMAFYEFHYVKDLADDQWLSLSFFVISDTGFIQGDGDKETLSSFTDPELSASRFAFILRKTHWEPFPFMEDKIQMRNFIKADGSLPKDLIEAGFVGKCYDMSCLTSESEANKVVCDIIAFAKERSWPLELKKMLH